ncbi:hypothetical protein HGRIS_000361 [Hohenbuehelia grisea]|uniref:Uncharacterized protein n=1 Tax=Hohenbuehelia grisea TaxID=104357 RepID=A0ABR3JSR3_9AGAR
MSSQALNVGHFGSPQLKGAKHWSFLLMKTDSKAIAYQVSGSTNTYAYKEPEDTTPEESNAFMGMVTVGSIDTRDEERFVTVLQNVPITRGDREWNCQNWIVEALRALKDNGFDVKVLTKVELADMLSKVTVGPRRN